MNDLFDYTFWLDRRDGPVQESVVVRAQPDEETAQLLVPEPQRHRISSVDEQPTRERVSITDLQLLAGLADRPEWAALRRACEQRLDNHFRKLARIFQTEGVAPDYDRLQWQRGVFAGVKLVLDEPHKIAHKRSLERLLDEEGD